MFLMFIKKYVVQLLIGCVALILVGVILFNSLKPDDSVTRADSLEEVLHNAQVSADITNKYTNYGRDDLIKLLNAIPTKKGADLGMSDGVGSSAFDTSRQSDFDKGYDECLSIMVPKELRATKSSQDSILPK